MIGYKVIYYSDHNAPGRVIHSPSGRNVLIGGEIEQAISSSHTFDFTVAMNNDLYGTMQAIVGLIDVYLVGTLHGKQINDLEFRGRIMGFSAEMESDGMFIQSVNCSDLTSYLHDSTQPYQRIPNNGYLDLFTKVIQAHNADMPPHKQFKVGSVDISAESDVPVRYIGYQTTRDTIKEHLLEKIGGVILLRHEDDGMYLDWIDQDKAGEYVESPIQWQGNLLKAQRTEEYTDLITQLVPIGADIEQDLSDAEQANIDAYDGAVRPRITIDNGGVDYVEDKELVDIFGVINRPIEWVEIDDAGILLERAKQYMADQKAFLTSWTTETAELWLLDERFDKFKVGNFHPIEAAPMSGIEQLQIAAKRININDITQVSLDIGEDQRTLSKFQLQMQEATKSIERVKRENANTNYRNQQLIDSLNAQIDQLFGVEGAEGIIADLQRQIDELRGGSN